MTPIAVIAGQTGAPPPGSAPYTHHFAPLSGDPLEYLGTGLILTDVSDAAVQT